MKKMLLFSFAMASLFSSAQNVTIPDANFKSFLIGQSAINTNMDTEIQEAEAAAFTATMYCHGQSITDLTGIEAFTSMSGLYCINNQITTMDLSMNIALTYIKCDDNLLTSLDVSQNINLLNLFCNSNQLTYLNVANGANTTLQSFEATGNSGLTCIQVDDVAYSNTNWTSIDPASSFSLSCSGGPLNDVVYVNHAASGANDGSSWTDAFNEVQDAISSASTNDELWVAQGTYYPTEDIIGNTSPGNPRSKTILINKDIDVYGGFVGTETSLNQRNWEQNVTLLSGDIGVIGTETDNCTRVVFVTSNSMIDGVSIEDAYVSGGYGGALHVNGSELLLKNSSVSNNLANSGGGMYIQASSSIEVNNCKFYNNTAENKGGAIYLESGDITVFNCIFDGNSAGYGGAISLQGNTAEKCRIANSLFSNNQTTLYGGTGIFAFEIPGGVEVVNSTFSKNSCPSCSSTNTGAIRSNNVNFTIQNCIVWDVVPITEASSNLSKFTVNNSVIKNGFTGNGNITTYPEFVDTTINDFNLQSNSVAINAGDTIGFELSIPLTDLNGNSRFVGNSVDIGCYEYQGVTTVDVFEKNVEIKLSLYPNPTNGLVYTNSKYEVAVVYDVSGKLIKTFTASATLDLTSMKEGVYLVKFKTKEGVVTKRILRN